MIATSFPRAGRRNRPSAAAYDRSPALYWTYADIGTFLFVVVLINDLIRLAVRLHFLHSSDLIVPRLAIQALIIIFSGLALYALLKFRYPTPVIAPPGGMTPSK